MPRIAKLGKHEGQWYTKAGNPSGVYFGSVENVPYRDAEKRFRAYLASLGKVQHQGITVAELMDKFLDWAEHRRGQRTFQERKQHLSRFVHYRRGDGLLADAAAASVKAGDLEAFLSYSHHTAASRNTAMNIARSSRRVSS